MTTRRGFLKATAGAAAMAAAGRAGRAPAQSMTPVKVGAVVLGDFGVVTPTQVAIEKGYFKQLGLDAELIPFKGGPDLLKGVLSGSADIGITGATDPLVFRERGTPIRALATIVEKNHFTLTVVPKVKRLEDLKGGTIGVTVVGSTTWVFARMLAKKMSWDPEKDVRIIGVGGLDAQMAALKRGEVQGSIFGDAGVVLEAEGAGHILMRLDELTPKWISLVAYSTDEIIKTKKDVLQRTLKGIFQGARFCRDNADESIKIASKTIGWPEPATRRAYELLRPLLSTDGRMDLDAFRFMQDTLLEVGVLKTRVPLQDSYTLEFTPVKL
ncbi:MAG TPA: ABC transporter substrate-binding protein [Candidatus Bathyarchaeia archaeon]|nr:ABC transporter substrate-binding protein [Candidatus Bathyarchaeia archaeon]